MRVLPAAAAAAITLSAAPAALGYEWTYYHGTGAAHLVVDFRVRTNEFGQHITSEVLAQLKGNDCWFGSAQGLGNARFVEDFFRLYRPGVGGQQRVFSAHLRGATAFGNFRTPPTPPMERDCNLGWLDWYAHRVKRVTIRDGHWTGSSDGRHISFDVSGGGRVISSADGELSSPSCDAPTPFHSTRHRAIIEPDGSFALRLGGLHPSLFDGRFSEPDSAQGFAREIKRSGCDTGWRGWIAHPPG